MGSWESVACLRSASNFVAEGRSEPGTSWLANHSKRCGSNQCWDGLSLTWHVLFRGVIYIKRKLTWFRNKGTLLDRVYWTSYLLTLLGLVSVPWADLLVFIFYAFTWEGLKKVLGLKSSLGKHPSARASFQINFFSHMHRRHLPCQLQPTAKQNCG